jgi:hypothetical protein
MIELEFRNVDFCGGRKTGEPGEKPSTTNSTPTYNICNIFAQKSNYLNNKFIHAKFTNYNYIIIII